VNFACEYVLCECFVCVNVLGVFECACEYLSVCVNFCV